MEKYKICPTCGRKYPPNQVECFPCETDLTGLLIMADTQEEENPGEKKFVRVCECGRKNPPQARRCAACGEDISDIPAVEDTPVSPAPREKGALVSLDGAYRCSLGGQELLVGRNHDLAEYLNGFLYVGRQQLKLLWEGDALFLVSLSRTNPTYVNNRPLQNGERVRLRNGDEIGLGGCVIEGKRQDQAAYFIVHLPDSNQEETGNKAL